MNSSQLNESKRSGNRIDILDCVKNNKIATLEILINANLIFYDMPIGSETLLGYTLKTTGVSEDTCELFLSQKKKVEHSLTQIDTIFYNILHNPHVIPSSDIALYTKCKTFNDALRKKVLGNQKALESMRSKDSKLKQIFPALDFEHAITLLKRHEVALQKNELFCFDEKFIQEAKQNPAKLKQIMDDLLIEKPGQTLAIKLTNYATAYSSTCPLSPLFKDHPEFVEECKERVKQLSDDTLKLTSTLVTKPQEAVLFYKNIFIEAYTAVDPDFLEECLLILDQHPAEKINLAAWEAIKKNDADRLASFTHNKDFTLFHHNRHIKQNNMLHYIAKLGHHLCLEVLLKYIETRKLNINFTTPEFIFNLLSSPHFKNCMSVLSESKQLTLADCKKIMRQSLTDFSDIPQNSHIIRSFNSAKIGIYHSTFVIVYSDAISFLTTPNSPLYQFLYKHENTLSKMIDRDLRIIQQVKDNKLDDKHFTFDDLQIKDLDGKTLFEIAADHKEHTTIQILKEKEKRQELFIKQFSELDGSKLYDLVMDEKLTLTKDKEFLEFFASDHKIATNARTTLYNWMFANNPYIFEFGKKYAPRIAQICAIFSVIFQKDKTSGENIIRGINDVKSMLERQKHECEDSDQIFLDLCNNKVSEKKIINYSTNYHLLARLEKKIFGLENTRLKLQCYFLIFNISEEYVHPFYRVFHGFKWFPYHHDHIFHENLLNKLRNDWEKEKIFLKGLKKTIEAKKDKQSNLNEQNIVPLTTLTNGGKPSFFKPPKETKEDETLTQPVVAAPTQSAPQRPIDKDEFDAMVATARI